MNKKSPKKENKKAVAIVKKEDEEVRKLVNMFVGSSSLVQNDKEQEKSLILSVAQAFAIPATCVNIMGGLPYINKDGLLFKLNEYEGKNIERLETKMVQYSKQRGEKAIAEAELTLKGGRFFNAIGEADENSVKLAAVKMTPNMMAETRAQNRVIRRAIQAKMLSDIFVNLGKNKTSMYDDKEKEVIINAVNSSAEEMSEKELTDKVQIIADSAKEKEPEIPTKKGLMELSLNKIKETTDEIRLSEYWDNIEKSNLYTKKDKEILYQAIKKQNNVSNNNGKEQSSLL